MESTASSVDKGVLTFASNCSLIDPAGESAIADSMLPELVTNKLLSSAGLKHLF